MSFIDIGIISVVGLCALVGLWRGTGKTLIKLLCFVLALLTCFFLSDYFLRFLLGVDAIKNLALGDTFSIYKLIKDRFGDVESATGVAKTLYDSLLVRYDALGGEAAWGASKQEFLAVAMSLHMFTIFTTAVLYAAARILATILGYVLKIIFVHGEPNLVSRIFGLVIGAAKGVLTVMILLFALSVVFPFSAGMNDQLTKSKTSQMLCNAEYGFFSERLYRNSTLEFMLENKFGTKSEPEVPGGETDQSEVKTAYIVRVTPPQADANV